MSLFQNWIEESLKQQAPSQDDCLKMLTDTLIDVPGLMMASYTIRYHFWKNKVRLHILNNVQNGSCPEDCSYCAQANNAKTDIAAYKMKTDDEIVNEAKRAYENGAFRYCMVFSGRGPRKRRVEHMAKLIKRIKDTVPVEVCLSAGLMDDDDTHKLKQAGLNRFNHNLNTSESYYKKICTTHTYQDRLNTLNSARNAGIELCSGFIAGMNEKPEDLVELAFKLKALNVESVPINFLIPISGTPMATTSNTLTPNYCLRILAMMRFVLPAAEIRMAAGRELHLKSNQILGLFAANSLFVDGYLNVKGTKQEIIQHIQDAGFEIEQEDNFLNTASKEILKGSRSINSQDVPMKTFQDLHPTQI